MGYSTHILFVGPEAQNMLQEKLAITFAGNAPGELRDYCFIIEDAVLEGHLAVGGNVEIGDQTWTITALGDLAGKNLSDLGHVTLVFDGESEPRMAGAIHLGGQDGIPSLTEGTRLVFHT